MKSEAKLSIILPVYNGEKYVKNTIKNVLRASYPNLELLVIDDGSTDRSLKICEECARLDSRVKVFHKENAGIADTRNFGLDHATGDYIGFCDQDDEIYREMYQKMMERILDDGSQAAICGCCRKKGNGKEIIFEQFNDAIYDKQDIQKKLLLPMLFRGFDDYDCKEISIYPTIWKCIISKNFIDEKQLRFYSFVSHEDDLVMMVQLLLKAERISTLADILYCWKTNTNSETYQCRRRYIYDLEQKQQNFVDYVICELEESKIRKRIIDKYIYVQQCRNVLLVLDNVAVLKDKKCSYKMKMIKGNQSVAYLQSHKKNIVKAEKGYIRNTVIIPLVREKHVFSAYILNKLIDHIRYFIEKYYIAELVERRIKGC